MDKICLCSNCVKPMRLKKMLHNLEIINVYEGSCIVCKESAISISNKKEFLENLVDNLRYFYPALHYIKKQFSYPYAAYFPLILEPYIFENANEIFIKPISKEASINLYTVLDKETTIHRIELFDITETEGMNTILEKLHYNSHVKNPLKDSMSTFLNNLLLDLEQNNYYIVEEKYISAMMKIKDSFPVQPIFGKEFYRARIGFNQGKIAVDDLDTTIKFPYIDEELMAPPPYMAGNGRFNRQGCSFLYLANSPSTAIAELRPYVGAICSIAKIKCKDNLPYVDLRKESLPNENTEHSLVNINIVRSLAYYITTPMKNSNEYFATQFISDLFRKMGFGGIIYDSVQTEGYNILSYYPQMYNCIEKSEELLTVNSVTYSTKKEQDERTKYENWYFHDEELEEKYHINSN